MTRAASAPRGWAELARERGLCERCAGIWRWKGYLLSTATGNVAIGPLHYLRRYRLSAAGAWLALASNAMTGGALSGMEPFLSALASGGVGTVSAPWTFEDALIEKRADQPLEAGCGIGVLAGAARHSSNP